MLKRLFLFVGFFLAIPVFAQVVPIQEQRCFAPACGLNPWKTVNDGDTLVVIVRPNLVSYPVCKVPLYCGGQAILVSDNFGNVYKPTPPFFDETWPSEAFVAFNVHGRRGGCPFDRCPEFIIGVMASLGYSGYGTSNGGAYTFDVLVLEYPPATGFDGVPSFVYGGPTYLTGAINLPNITTTSPNTLLIAWVVNRSFGNGPPFPLDFVESPWSILSDDGYLAVSTRTANGPGTYDFKGQYTNGTTNPIYWYGGIVGIALK